ncbi:MAG: SpoIIE family protein phosphatase [Cyclobacteriaceae bacterium]|nr:SpoIIE family protein phosphatase [Cyclobacteriaceae bacterium]
MALSGKNIATISVVFSAISWMIMLASSLLIQFEKVNMVQNGLPIFVPYVFYIFFVLLLYVFYRAQVLSADGINVIDLLWRVFVTGLVATLLSLLARYFLMALEGSQHANNPYFLIIIFEVHLGLATAYLISIFVVWKRLVLYQKNRKLLRIWQFFETSFFFSFLFFFFHKGYFDISFNLILGFFAIMSFVLSANLKWVAYLNYRQKWNSILLLLLIAFYILYFLRTIHDLPGFIAATYDMTQNITLLALFAFTFVYSVFSMLVLLFNLPTSSVFEQKFEEVINFQRLSQSRNTGHDEKQVYDILLESSVSAVMANGAWLEVYNDEDAPMVLYHKISPKRRLEILEKLQKAKIKKLRSSDPVKDMQTRRFMANINDLEYRSILAFPLYVQNRELGMLYLLKDLYDGFNKEMIEIIRTFANQASISVENFKLLKEAIDNERYKEQLKIAKSFQKILLPENLDRFDDFEIAAYSKAAAEVGGDFYDSYKSDDDRIALTIGDVSGKGTSAAFSMSQMKAIFQSLNMIDLPLHEFTNKTNLALGKCLERTLFITAIFLRIYKSIKTIEYSRAGHCPLLYYTAHDNMANYLELPGMGLGVLRDVRYENHIQVGNILYRKGDILVMYTDGIIEARNESNEEYGYDRLKKIIESSATETCEEIENSIVKSVFNFCGARTPDDDFTLVIIKFK